jgi:hypothetical protein
MTTNNSDSEQGIAPTIRKGQQNILSAQAKGVILLPPERRALYRRLDKTRRRLIDDAEAADGIKRRLLKEAAEIKSEMDEIAA